MTDNRALWELVETWRSVDPYLRDKRVWAAYFANELAAILERPVVVEEDDDGMPVGYAGWYNRKFAGQPVDVTRDHHCEEAWRACLESMVRGKS